MSKPLTCPAELREILSWMGAELDMTGLRVDLVPAPDPHHCGHKIRRLLGNGSRSALAPHLLDMARQALDEFREAA